MMSFSQLSAVKNIFFGGHLKRILAILISLGLAAYLQTTSDFCNTGTHSQILTDFLSNHTFFRIMVGVLEGCFSHYFLFTGGIGDDFF